MAMLAFVTQQKYKTFDVRKNYFLKGILHFHLELLFIVRKIPEHDILSHSPAFCKGYVFYKNIYLNFICFEFFICFLC